MKKLKEILKEKKILIILISVVIILVIGVVLITTLNNRKLIGSVNSPDEDKFKDEYEKLNEELTEDGKKYPEVKLPKNNLIKYSTTKEILTIFENKKDAVVYFGFPTCLYCRSAIEVLCNTAKNTKLETIYYLNVEQKEKEHDKLLKALGDELVNTDKGKKELIAPLVIFIVDGKVISYNKGTLFSQEDPYKELDPSQTEGLSEIYKYGIRDVVDSINKKKEIEELSK